MSENIDVKVAKNGQRLDEHERRIRAQEEKNEQLGEIATYSRLLYEHNKVQDGRIEKAEERASKQFEHITSVLDGINSNLLSLNHDVKHVKDKQDQTDDIVERLEAERVKELHALGEQREKELAEFKKERRNLVFKVISAVVVAMVLGYLGLK